jgi:hypothetical protein
MTSELADAVAAASAVWHWRVEELLRVGYKPWDALVLGQRADVDLHVACALLEEGCPVVLALRILL